MSENKTIINDSGKLSYIKNGDVARIWDARATTPKTGFFTHALRQLQRDGIKTIIITLQSNSMRNTLISLVKSGVLLNPRNIVGSSTDEHPSTFDIKESMFPKEFNRKALGSCMSAAAMATTHLKSKGITKFHIVEGFVSMYPNQEPEDWSPHTWIEFDNGRIFDPTKKQWTKLGFKSEETEYKKVVRKFTPDQYEKLCKIQSINESPDMSLSGKIAIAGDKPLKTSTVTEVQGNIVILRTREPGIFAAGMTLIYFMDTEQSADSMKKGQIPYLMVPRGTFYSGGNPITDIWKKRFQKPGTEHILGVLEGHSEESLIYVDMLTVRPGWQRNSIASKMMGTLKTLFPNAELKTSSTTDKGAKFLKSYKKTHNINENSNLKNLVVEMVKDVLMEGNKIYGWWIDSSGKSAVVDHEDHRYWAVIYLKSKNDPEPAINTYQKMYSLGFIRAVKEHYNGWGIYYQYDPNKTPAPKQIKEMKDLAMENNCKYIYDDVTKRWIATDEAFINENMTYKELLDLTTPERKERSSNVRVRSIPVNVENGQQQWRFRYKSSPTTTVTNKPFEGNITFFKEDIKSNEDAMNLDCKVDCGCPDYMYKFAYNNMKQDAGDIGNDSLNKCVNRSPQPAYDIGEGLCKHLAALRGYLQTKITATKKSNLFEALNEVSNQGPFNIEYTD